MTVALLRGLLMMPGRCSQDLSRICIACIFDGYRGLARICKKGSRYAILFLFMRIPCPYMFCSGAYSMDADDLLCMCLSSGSIMCLEECFQG